MYKGSNSVAAKLRWWFLCFLGVLFLLTGSTGTQSAIGNSDEFLAGEAPVHIQKTADPQYQNFLPII